MATLATLTVKILGDTGQLTSSLERAQKRSKSFTDGLRKARGPLLALTGASVGLGVGAVKAFGDFDQAMTQSLAIMGDVSDTMRGDMVAAAEEVGRSTTFSARDAAESFFFLASAGLDAEASITALGPVAQFAQAGMFDMALATDLLTDAQSALGLTIRDDAVANMENMVRVGDTLVKANTLANASVQQFSEALTQKAGAALRLVGKDVEEGVAVLAAFADQGIKGSEAGTQLGIVMRDLQTKAIQNAAEFRGLNVSVFDSQGEMRNFADILRDLEGALAGASDETKKATLLNLGFSDRSVAALQAIIGMSGAIADYERKLRTAGGTTKEVADKQLTAFNAQMKIAKDRTEIAMSQLGEKFAPAVLKAVDALAKAVEWFSKLDSKTISVIAGVIATTAAIAALGLIIPPLVTGFGALAAVLGVLTTINSLGAAAVWANVTAWIALNVATGGIIIGIGLLVAGLVLLVKNWDVVVRAVKTGANFMIGVIEKMVNIWLLQFNVLIKAFNLVAGMFGAQVSEIELIIPRIGMAMEETTDEIETTVSDSTQAQLDSWTSMQSGIIDGQTDVEDAVVLSASTMLDALDVMYFGVETRVSESVTRQLDSWGTMQSGILAGQTDTTNAVVRSIDLMIVAYDVMFTGVESQGRTLTEVLVDNIVTLEDRMAMFGASRVEREQATVAKIMFMSQNLAQDQANLAQWGTQFFIQANDDKLLAFEKYSQGFMTIDQAIRAVELDHIEEVGRERLADMELRIRAEEEFAKLQQRNLEEQARRTRIAVGLLPPVIASNINQGRGDISGAAYLKNMGFNIETDPNIFNGKPFVRNQNGDPVLLRQTDDGNSGRRAEVIRRDQERRQTYIENVNVVTPAVLGDNVVEVVAAALRDGIDRGLIDLGFADA